MENEKTERPVSQDQSLRETQNTDPKKQNYNISYVAMGPKQQEEAEKRKPQQ